MDKSLEEGKATIKQERHISARFRLHSRSAALLHHKGKLGMGLLIIFMIIVTLAVAIPCWQKPNCEQIGQSYQLCNHSLATLDNSHCYSYKRGKEIKNLRRIYDNCVTKWLSTGQRCQRAISRARGQIKVVAGNETSYAIPTAYDHIFFMRMDDNDSLDVQTFINGSCILNSKETAALFKFL